MPAPMLRALQLVALLLLFSAQAAGAAILENGVALTGLSGALGTMQFYTLQVPAGASNLTIKISGGSGDADLYVRYGAAPTLTAYDCRPYSGGNNETCAMPAATAGTWHVMIHAYKAFSNITLVASYTASGGGGTSTPLQNGVSLTSVSGALGTMQFYTLQVPAGASNLTIKISGGSGDADLYVRYGAAPTLTTYDCRPYSGGNNETCAMPAATEGTWHVMIHAYKAFSSVTLVASYGANLTPFADAGPDQTVAEGVSVQLNGAGSYDIEGQPLTYQWSQTAGPLVVLSNPTAAAPSFVAPIGLTQTLQLTFQLMVSDGFTSSASDLINISVLAGTFGNQPPVANNACVNTPRGVSTGGFLNVTDPEGGPVTYELVSDGTKGNVTINAATGQFTYTPCSAPGSPACTPAASGTGFVGMDKFTFRATDQIGLSSTAATVTVLIDGAVRIMPLGDSITSGAYASPNPPNAERVGYRRPLYDQLEALSPNYAVNFVGGLSFGLSANPAIVDPDHEGHGGFCAGPNGNNPSYCATTGTGNLADNVIAWLDANPADIILLHTGTNAFITSASDMDILLDRIETWQASNYPITVFVARILQDASSPFLSVNTFNNNMESMIIGRAATNPRYVIVNQQTGAGINYTIGAADGSPTGSDMADDLHPNQDGYDKMAAKWLSDLANPANVGPKFVGLPQCP